MKAAVLCLALALAATAEPIRPVDEAGVQRLLSENKGKVVLVNFWATWCEPCRSEMPDLVALEKKLAGKGFDVVTISTDEPEQLEDARKFLASKSVAPPFYIRKAKNDDQFINNFDPKWSGAVPALFLYDRQGRRVKSFIGETPIATIEREIRKLL
ncbi:MAG TPA: TlpA disulfide reductase family protein [Bryobacteraceae bacterium]|jgi:thiol-disulfide isomerase/thioredoxin|nr:TlpA disulfide reductase family protein [Bryobacteraceae bacterium]